FLASIITKSSTFMLLISSSGYSLGSSTPISSKETVKFFRKFVVSTYPSKGGFFGCSFSGVSNKVCLITASAEVLEGSGASEAGYVLLLNKETSDFCSSSRV